MVPVTCRGSVCRTRGLADAVRRLADYGSVQATKIIVLVGHRTVLDQQIVELIDRHEQLIRVSVSQAHPERVAAASIPAGIPKIDPDLSIVDEPRPDGPVSGTSNDIESEIARRLVEQEIDIDAESGGGQIYAICNGLSVKDARRAITECVCEGNIG